VAPLVKDAFLIDLGTASLPPDLIARLSAYNLGRERPLQKLWVMAQGRIYPVPLQ